MTMVKRTIAIFASLSLLMGAGAFALMSGAAASGDSPDTTPTVYEDFEGRAAVTDAKLGFPYGNEQNKLEFAKSGSNLLISGEQSIVVKHAGGDGATFSIGDSDHLRFAPDKKYTVSFLMKFDGSIPADFNMMLQVMAWTNGNWGDEMYVKAADGKLVFDRVIKGSALRSLIVPSASVEDKGDGLYKVTAVFGGSRADNNGSFFRLRPMGATAVDFSVDDITVDAEDLVVTEDFEGFTAIDEYGVFTGTKNVRLAYPSAAANANYGVAKLSDDASKAVVITGNQSVLVKKSATTAELDALSFGNAPSAIYLDPTLRYVFNFDIKFAGEIPDGFQYDFQLMNWIGTPTWSDAVNLIKGDNGKLAITGSDTEGYMLDAAVNELGANTYHVAIALKGIDYSEKDQYAGFVRSYFPANSPAVTFGLDNFAIRPTQAAAADFVVADPTDPTNPTNPTVPTTPTESTKSTEATTTTKAPPADMSKLGNPIAFEDMEKATGKVDGPGVSVEGTIFNWPFPGQEKFLKVAEKGGDNASAVIGGDKSLLVSTVGQNATGNFTVNTAASPVCIIDPSKTYVASYKLKLVEMPNDSYLSMVVHTWTHGDPWLTIQFKKDASGNLTGTVTENAQDVSKVAIKKLSADTYYIGVRFTGIPKKNDCHLFWELGKDSTIAIDEFALYESDRDPALAFEKPDAGAEDPVDTGAATLPLVGACAVLAASASAAIIMSRKKK